MKPVLHRPLCLVLVGAGLLLVACGSDGDPAPEATILEYTPESLDPANDTADDLTIRLEYADNDGDLGDGVANVHDCRSADLIVTFDIPPIASEEAIDKGVPIEGTLELVIADVSDLAIDASGSSVCSDLGESVPAAGTATFCVVLVDAAGNEGAGDCTGVVNIASN